MISQIHPYNGICAYQMCVLCPYNCECVSNIHVLFNQVHKSLHEFSPWIHLWVISQRKFFPTLNCFKCIKSCRSSSSNAASQFKFPWWSLAKFFPSDLPLNWRTPKLIFWNPYKGTPGKLSMKTILFIYQNFNWTQSFILRIIHDFFSNSEMKK